MRWLNNLHELDVNTFTKIQALPNIREQVKYAKITSWFANGPLYAVIGIALLASGNSTMGLLFIVGFGVERCLYFIFKTTFKRNRPAAALNNYASFIIPSDKFSFPSGHTSGAFLFTVLVASQIPALLIILLPWAVSVAWARVTLGVHFPTDTLAGAALGSLTGLTLLEILV